MTDNRTKAQRLFYRFVMAVGSPVVRFLHPLNLIGAENLPKDGSFVMIANHVSLWDVAFITSMLLPRYTTYMSKSELYEKKWFGWIITSLGAFPVHRGTSDMKAVKTAIDHVRSGHVFGIFPEGTRNRKWDGTIQEFNRGVALIALSTKAPVIPAYFANQRGFRLFRKVHIRIGKPIELDEFYGHAPNSERLTLAAQRMYEALSGLSSDPEGSF